MSRTFARLGKFTSKRYLLIISITSVASLFMLMATIHIEANTTVESFQCDSEVYKAQKRYEDAFRPSYHGIPLVFVAEDGNILTMDNIREIAYAFDAANRDPHSSSWAFDFYVPELLVNMTSFRCMANDIQYIMNGKSPLFHDDRLAPLRQGHPDVSFDNADDDDLNVVLDYLFNITDDSGINVYQNSVSSDLEKADGRWSGEVMMAFPFVQREPFEEKYTYELEDEEDKEYFEVYDLGMIDIMREELEDVEIYGVGVGIDDEIEKEIAQSGPLIMFAFIVIIVVLYISLREDIKCFIAAAVGLPLVVVWMMGTAKVLGLGATQFTALLPVLIMALGIDYAIHSMKRYREEINRNQSPRKAVEVSVTKLGGTLALAMVTTFVAFFSTQLSTIPALKDWGLEAGLAIVWAFLIMGIFIPALRLAMEGKYKDLTPKELSKVGKKKDIRSRPSKIGRGIRNMGRRSVRRPGIILIFVLLVTLPLAYGTVNLDSEFDVKEFFDNGSDFVVGMDYYMDGFPTGGEPTILLIEGDIAEPDVLLAINQTRENINERGYATWYIPDAALLVRNFTTNLMVNNLAGGSDIQVTDENGDGIPDRKEEVEDILTQLTTKGLFSLSNGTPVMVQTPDFIEEIIHFDEEDGTFDMTNLQIGVPGSDSLEAIRRAKANIDDDARPISETGQAQAIVTGTPIQRNEQLTAISESMRSSMIATVIICFFILLALFRRFAYSVMAILPVILISIWLYGAMHFFDYSLNVVTATIGAMSIGVGVDFSIHICDRFRKERGEGRGFRKSLDNTMEHTGAALFFSTMTTALGFFILILAPMPMFMSFGLFSALMVLLALASSVVVLPPLIKIIEGGGKKKESKVDSPVRRPKSSGKEKGRNK